MANTLLVHYLDFQETQMKSFRYKVIDCSKALEVHESIPT